MNIDVLLAIWTAAVVALFVGVVYPAIRKDAQLRKEVDYTLVKQYCELVTASLFEQAYHDCLAESYRDDLPAGVYLDAQIKRRNEYGNLKRWEFRKADPGRTLYLPVNEVQILYKLHYEKKTALGWIIATNAEGEWKIIGTYSERMYLMVW